MLANEDKTEFKQTPAIRAQFNSLNIEERKYDKQEVKYLNVRGNKGKNAKVFS